MYTPTITYSDLKHCDLVFYRPRSLFGKIIAIFEAIKDGKIDRMAFSHVGIILKDKKGSLKIFEALEGARTGFRMKFDRAYVYAINNATESHKEAIQRYALSREGSRYDRHGVFSFLFPKLANQDEFCDYCSELVKDSLVSAGLVEDTERVTPYELYKKIREGVTFKGIIL